MTIKIIKFIIKYFYAAASCLYLFTVGFFITRNRILISKICEHFRPFKESTQISLMIIPEIEPLEAVLKDILIQIAVPDFADGSISLIETAVIARLIKQHNPVNIFEIGTFNGRTTTNMAANCVKEAKIYTLDLPREQQNSTKLPVCLCEKKFIDKPVIGSNFVGTDYAKNIIQLFGDSARFDFSPFFGKMDFIFIDGSHSYEYVMNDSKQALKLLRKKGIILWHDYHDRWGGVANALNELYLNDARFKNLKHIKKTNLVLLAN